MFANIYNAVTNYFSELGYFIDYQTKNITPDKYAYILIGVGVFGWLLMRNQKK